MKAVVAAFNQEKALVGAFSVITNLDAIRMQLFEALIQVHTNICTKTRAKKRKPYDVVKVNV